MPNFDKIGPSVCLLSLPNSHTHNNCFVILSKRILLASLCIQIARSKADSCILICRTVLLQSTFYTHKHTYIRVMCIYAYILYVLNRVKCCTYYFCWTSVNLDVYLYVCRPIYCIFVVVCERHIQMLEFITTITLLY